jgi:hypothetical protein
MQRNAPRRVGQGFSTLDDALTIRLKGRGMAIHAECITHSTIICRIGGNFA